MNTQHEWVSVKPLTPAGRTGPVLRRRRVTGALCVGVEPVHVVVELGVFDHQRATRIGTRVTRGRCSPSMSCRPTRRRAVGRLRCTCRSRRSCSHRSGSTPRDLGIPRRRCRSCRRPTAAADCAVEGVGRRQVAALVAVEPDLAGAVTAIPPDLVPTVARLVPSTVFGELEVAHREVVDRVAVGPDVDPVPTERDTGRVQYPKILVGGVAAALRGTGLGAVHDDRVAVHSPKMDVVGMDGDTAVPSE